MLRNPGLMTSAATGPPSFTTQYLRVRDIFTAMSSGMLRLVTKSLSPAGAFLSSRHLISITSKCSLHSTFSRRSRRLMFLIKIKSVLGSFQGGQGWFADHLVMPRECQPALCAWAPNGLAAPYLEAGATERKVQGSRLQCASPPIQRRPLKVRRPSTSTISALHLIKKSPNLTVRWVGYV